VKPKTKAALLAVAEVRQQEGVGWDGSRPDGTGTTTDAPTQRYRNPNTPVKWSDLLHDEVEQAIHAAPESVDLEAALARVAGVTVAWMEDLQTRRRQRVSVENLDTGTVIHVRIPGRKLSYRAIAKEDQRVHIPALGITLPREEVLFVTKEEPITPKKAQQQPLRAALLASLAELKSS